MSDVTLFHNPKCSKSRAVHALLAEHGAEFAVVNYLSSPLTKAELRTLSDQLQRPVADLVRTGDDAFKALPDAGSIAVDDDALLTAVADNPALMQRPVVRVGSKAAIGRPPEAVLTLLKDANT